MCPIYLPHTTWFQGSYLASNNDTEQINGQLERRGYNIDLVQREVEVACTCNSDLV
jgi:hypothetical protein